MRLLLALTLAAAACTGDPPAPADVARVDAPEEPALCAVGSTERCDSECGQGTGYRRCTDEPSWSRCFCEAPDAAADTALDAPVEATVDVALEAVADAGSDAPSIDASDTSADADAACETRCDGACVDTGSDPLNCGACGMRCMVSAPHTRAQCFAGRCERPCEVDYDDCNGNLADGCETFLRGTDRTHCGSCRGVCNSAERCVMGVCRPL